MVEGDRSCSVSVTSNPLHISSSSSSSQLVCGTKTQPWILEAAIGQRISVSLLDFNVAILSERSRDERREPADDVCLSYGFIVDKSARKNISICGRTPQREQVLYLSKTNTLEVVLSTLQVEDKYNFLLRLEGLSSIYYYYYYYYYYYFIYYALSSSVMFSHNRMNLKREAVYD